MAQSINLIPRQEIVAQRKVRIVKFSSVLTVVVLLMVSGVSFYYSTKLKELRKQSEDLKSKVEGIRSDIKSMEELEIKARTVDTKYQVLNNFVNSRFAYSRLLEEVKARTPNDIVLKSFDITLFEGEKRINLTGVGESYPAIARYLNLLNDKEFEGGNPDLKKIFVDVTLNNVSLDSQSLDVSFTITTKFDESLLK